MKKISKIFAGFVLLATTGLAFLPSVNKTVVIKASTKEVDPRMIKPECPEFVLEDASQIWDGTSVAESYEGGDGSETNPFQIATAAQLKKFQSESNVKDYGKGLHYLITRDIDLNNKAWTPISREGAAKYGYYFSGHLSGKYNDNGVTKSHLIANLSITQSSAQGWGFFHTLKNSTIEYLTFQGSFDVKDRAGSLAYYTDTVDVSHVDSFVNITIESTSSVTSNIGYVGGIVGNAAAKTNFSFCRYAGDIVVNKMYYTAANGGIVGQGKNSTFTSCDNYGKVAATKFVGGIIGYGNSTNIVTDCYNLGNVKGCGEAGGIIGDSITDTVSNCKNYGNIEYVESGNSKTPGSKKGYGGIIGWATTNSKILASTCGEDVIITASGGNSGYLSGYAGAGCEIDCEGSIYKILGTSMTPYGFNNNLKVVKKFCETIIGYASVVSGNAYTPNDANLAAPEGRTFNGWYVDETLLTPFEDGTELTTGMTLYSRFALDYAVILDEIKATSSCTEYGRLPEFLEEISFLTDTEQENMMAESFTDYGGYVVTVAEKLAAMAGRIGDPSSSSTGINSIDITSNQNITLLCVLLISTCVISVSCLLIVKKRKKSK